MLTNSNIQSTQSVVTRRKAYTWNKLEGDRFIPRRTTLNLRNINFPLSDLDFDIDDDNSEISNHSDLLKQNLIDSQTISTQRPFFKYRTKTEPQNILDLLSEQSEYKSSKPLRRKFVLPEKPFKILEAPHIPDDFYYDIFDWSSNNILGICLANSIYMMNGESDKVTKLYEAFDCESITSLRWNESGDQLAVGNILGQVSIWDVNKQKEIISLDSHEDRVCALDWRSTLISGSKDTNIIQHDLRVKKAQINTYQFHTQEVCKLMWSPDEQYFCSGGNDNKVLVWTPTNSMPIMRESHNACVKALAWSEKQYGVLATGGGASDKMIKTWNVRTRELIQERDTGSQVCSLVFSKLTNDIISAHGYPSNEITVWRANGLKKVGSIYGHLERVLYLKLSPCASTVVSCSGDETLRFWKLYENKVETGSQLSSGTLETSNIR